MSKVARTCNQNVVQQNDCTIIISRVKKKKKLSYYFSGSYKTTHLLEHEQSLLTNSLFKGWKCMSNFTKLPHWKQRWRRFRIFSKWRHVTYPSLPQVTCLASMTLEADQGKPREWRQTYWERSEVRPGRPKEATRTHLMHVFFSRQQNGQHLILDVHTFIAQNLPKFNF